MVLSSERLKYQLMTPDDADLLFQLDQDKEVMRYINGGKVSSMQDIHKVFIPRMLSYTNVERGWGLWKVEVKQTCRFIGWVLVRPMAFFSETPELGNLEIGWRFKRDSWGSGYATEAALSVKQALLNHSQNNSEFKVNQLSAIAFEENKASINIMKKLGMIYLKTDLHKDPLGDNELVYYQMDLN